jgi:transglutaminase-like putative cysteine protease
MAWLGVHFRQHPLLVAAQSAVVFFLVGGAIALPSTALGGVLPTATTVRDLGSGIINSWSQLLTTQPPAGASGNLLVVPYLCGFASATLGFSMARRLSRPVLAVAPPTVVLALSILLGTSRPVSVLFQGAVFGALCLAWVVLRARHTVSYELTHSARRSRLASGAVLLAAASALGLAVGPSLPMANAHPRYVLRNHVQPPLDPAQYPSPLNAYRSYLESQKNLQLFSVTGLPAGARIRLATMDAYDGLVWSVVNGANGATDASGYFARVGDEITRPVGKTSKVSITVEGLRSVWVPDVGTVTSMSFAGPRAGDLRNTFRFNPQTDTGVVTSGLTAGDRLTMAVMPQPTSAVAAAGHAPASVSLPTLTNVPDVVQAKASDIVNGASKGANAAASLESWLKAHGGYSDGGSGAAMSLPGHGAARMLTFLSADQPVGDDEQFASALALMARQSGLAARVVMGFAPAQPAAGTVQVTGADISVWTEVDFDGVGWLPFFPTPPKTQVPQQQQAQSQPQNDTVNQQQHRHTDNEANNAPAADAGADSHKVAKTTKPPVKHPAHRRIPVAVLAVGLPLLLIAVLLGGIIGVKALRRRRRRSTGTTGQRIHAGWIEIIDTARDLGRPIPSKATRREMAQFVGAGIVPLARRADEASFGPDEPTEEQVATFWDEVTQSRTDLLAGAGAGGRAKAALSLVSLRQGRRGQGGSR